MTSHERSHRLHLRTPEGVTFSFRLASPVLRLSALLIDWLVILAAWSLLGILFTVLGVIAGDAAQGLAIVGFFLLSQGYRIGTEWLWRGQTIGKRVVKLRVVDARGLSLTFPQVMLRNLIRFIDALPAFYAVGGAATLLTTRAQRLGDLAAGTVVIWEPAEPAPDLSTIRTDKYNSLRAHPALVARLRQAVSPVAARAAWHALARRDQFEPAARVALFAEMATHFRGLTAWPSETTEGVGDEQLVRNVVEVLLMTRA